MWVALGDFSRENPVLPSVEKAIDLAHTLRKTAYNLAKQITLIIEELPRERDPATTKLLKDLERGDEKARR